MLRRMIRLKFNLDAQLLSGFNLEDEILALLESIATLKEKKT